MDGTASNKQAVPSAAVLSPEDAKSILQNADCLYTQIQVEQAIDNLAKSVSQFYEGLNPLLLVVMTGGFIFAGRLATRLNFPLQIDYVHATRYRSGTHGHDQVEWRVYPDVDVRERHVLLVDDILDEGRTLHSVVESCLSAEAASVGTVVLVDKQHNRKFRNIKADFSGLSVNDRYVFGYGLDYHEYLRNVPGIYAVAETSSGKNA
ncbi:hypoxanthine-guanine phosphoribosyltransferase [Acidihalobacter prosperus]